MTLAFVPGFATAEVTRFPVHRSKDVNPDTHLVLIFKAPPTLGSSGQIRVYDAADDRLVDLLDLSIPPGPTERADAAAQAAPYTSVPYEYPAVRATNATTKPGTPSGVSRRGLSGFQLNIIGGFTDAFHFYPVIVRDNVATITLHNNLLEYGRTYYIQIDLGVLTLEGSGFEGIKDRGWTFSTRRSKPSPDAERLVVSASGAGDFNTVQGALDFVPDQPKRRITIFVKNGDYEEIVYFRRKSNLTILGEDREKVVVHYRNNEVFNPHPPDVSTNEVPGTFPSRRAAFMGDNVKGIHLVNLTIKTTAKGQAEGLLLTGEENIVSHVTIVGSGDALQVNGTAYFTECRITGDGDTILGRGAAFFERCDLESKGPFMWVRNTAANHGNVFVESRFRGLGPGTSDLARSPVNGGKTYTHAEAVLIDCLLANISPAGWGAIGGDGATVRFWEYRSRNLDGTPVDVRGRHPFSRQLTAEGDAEVIARYRDPSYVLGGWRPAMAPVILQQPESVSVLAGESVILRVRAAAVPAATIQWFRNGKIIPGATTDTLELRDAGASAAAAYTATVTNASARMKTDPATVTIRRP
jgi:pectinesterase